MRYRGFVLSSFFIALLTMLVHVDNALAWQPCTPFCDPCGSGAMAGLTANVSASLNALGQTQQALNNQITSANSNFTSFSGNLTTTLQNEFRTAGTLPSLEAFTNRIAGEIVRNTKARENLTDYTTNEFVQRYSDTVIAEQVTGIHRQFEEFAQPAAGAVGVCKAEWAKTAAVQKKQINNDLSNELNERNIVARAQTQARSEQEVMQLAVQNDQYFRSMNVLQKATITDQDSEAVQWLLSVLSNSKPLPQLTAGNASKGSAGRYELNRRVFNSRMAMVQEVLADQLTDRLPLVDPSWITAYAGIQQSEKISLNEAMQREIEGRLETPGWMQNVAELSKTGLLRELNYLAALENKLLLEILEKRNHKNRLLALISAIELNEDKPTFVN